MDGRTALETVDREVLTPVVRQALRSSAAEVLAWQARPGGLVFTPQTGGVHRFDGTARLGDQTVPWSVVLKVAMPFGLDDPTSSHYWKRELLAY